MDEDVERVRRAHLNDIENVFPFFFLGGLYLTTNPAAHIAKNLFRIFAAARIGHTVVYLAGVRQPARGICFAINMVINVYFVYSIMSHYINFM